MGCDIHYVLEQNMAAKDAVTPLWVGVACSGNLPDPEGLYIGGPDGTVDASRLWATYKLRSRDYSFFAALAGVRGDGPVPRGVPNDASVWARKEINAWDSDGHNHSWHTAVEFIHKYCKANDIDPIKIVDVFRSHTGFDLDDINDFRFIFWFDN